MTRLKGALDSARPPTELRRVVFALTVEEKARFIDWYETLASQDKVAFWQSTPEEAIGQLEIEGVKLSPVPQMVSHHHIEAVDKEDILEQVLRDKDRRGRPRDLPDEVIKFAVSEANLDLDAMRVDLIRSLSAKYAKKHGLDLDALTDADRLAACQDLTKHLRAKILETIGDLFAYPERKVTKAIANGGWAVVQQGPILRPNPLREIPYGYAALLRIGDCWGVAYSTIATAKETHQLFVPKFDQKEAHRVYKDLFLPAARKHAAFRRLRDYRREVELLVAKDRWSTEEQRSLPFHVGFFIALYVHYDMNSRVRWAERHSGRVYRNLRDRVIALTNNVVLPEGEGYDSMKFADLLVVPLAATDERMDTPIKKQAFRDRVDWLRRGLTKAIEIWPARYGHLSKLRDRLKEVEERVAESENRQWHQEDRFPAFSRELTEKILDAAWAADINIYLACVLQLSTCLRNNEIQRLSRDFLLHDCTLDYRRPRLIAATGVEEYLSTKTTDKIERTELTNPRASIVTRVILRHFLRYQYPAEHLLKNFWDGLKVSLDDSRVRNGRTMRKGLIVPRALRTTGATMLRFTRETLFFPRIENEIISARMTHSTTLMIERVYARNPPPGSDGLAPHVYLGFGECMVVSATVADQGHETVHECDISSQDCAWDAWLLRDLLDRYRAEIVAAEKHGPGAVAAAESHFKQLKYYVYIEYTKGLPMNVDPDLAKAEISKHYTGRTAYTRY